MQRGRRFRGLAAGFSSALLLGALSLALAFPAGSGAAVGDLSFDRCASNDGSGAACANLSGSSFDEPGALTVSPAGDPFVSVRASYNVTRFDPTLAFRSCVSNVATAGLCTDLVAPPLYSPPGDVVVTPDGGTMYVSGPANDAVTRYAVGPDGTLAYQACASDNGTGGACTNVPGSAFDAPAALAIAPDGDSLYVASRVSNSITHFGIGAGGALTFAGCVSDSGSGGDCTNIPGTVFATPAGLALAQDGSALYASASLSDTISRFALDPAGQITSFTGCVSNAATGTCTDLPGSPMLEPLGLGVAPGGASVHVAAGSSDSLVDLSVSPSGEMAFAGCSSQSGSAGTCVDLPDAFDAPSSIVVAGDGRSIYTNASVSDSVGRFDLAAGRATFSGCLSDTGSGGLCADVPGAALDRPVDLALNAAGSALFVTAADSDSVTEFVREVPDTTPPGLALKVKKKGKVGKPIALTVSCDEACAVGISGTVKADRGRAGKLPKKALDLAAGETKKVKLKPKRAMKRSLKRAGKGKARITVVAIDAAGNSVSASAVQKLR